MSTFATLALPPASSTHASTDAPTYLVRLRGIRPGLDPADVAAKLAPFFNRSAAQLVPALTGLNVVVKRGLDEDKAQRYVVTLRDAGCVCEAETEHKRIPAAPVAPEPRMAMEEQEPAWVEPPLGRVSAITPAPPTKVAEDPAMKRWLALNPPALPHASRGPIRPAAPAQEIETAEPHDPSLALMAIGQKLAIDAILLNMLARGLTKEISLIGLGLYLTVLAALSMFGLLRMVRGLQFSRTARVLTVLGGMVPGLSVIVMLAISMKVSRRLKDAGIEVGFLGVGKDERNTLGGAAPGELPYSRMPSVAALVAIFVIVALTR